MLRKHLKDAGLGLLITIALVFLMEAGLSAIGVGRPDVETPLSRGFSSTDAYLVPDPEVAGAFVTQFLGGTGLPEKGIPPKSERLRVILFGGSNTAGFGTDWLQRALDEREPGVFEVVNLGRAGYGSERVAIVLDQALDLLEPDLVVIYSGHNEFVERGFRMDLEDSWSSEWGRDLGQVARRSRIVNFMTDVLKPAPVRSIAQPERQKDEYKKFRGIQYDETLLYYRAYEQNLERMCRAATERGVGVLLSTVIHNRLSAPWQSTLPDAWSDEERAEFEAVRARVAAALPDALDPLLPEEGWQHVFHFDWNNEPEGRDRGNDLPGRRPCSGPFETQDPHLPLPKAKTRQAYRALARVFARDFDEAERAGLDTAARELERALELFPEHSQSLFEAGLVALSRSGDGARALELLEAAGVHDRAPRRGNAVTNDRVRAVAERVSEVVFLDADALFASRMPDGIVGFEWMIDHCHLAIGAREVLMADFADEIVRHWP